MLLVPRIGWSTKPRTFGYKATGGIPFVGRRAPGPATHGNRGRGGDRGSDQRVVDGPAKAERPVSDAIGRNRRRRVAGAEGGVLAVAAGIIGGRAIGFIQPVMNQRIDGRGHRVVLQDYRHVIHKNGLAMPSRTTISSMPAWPWRESPRSIPRAEPSSTSSFPAPFRDSGRTRQSRAGARPCWRTCRATAAPARVPWPSAITALPRSKGPGLLRDLHPSGSARHGRLRPHRFPDLVSHPEARCRNRGRRFQPSAVRCCLYVSVYGEKDRLELIRSPEASLGPGRQERIDWTVPSTGGRPIAEVGVEVSAEGGAQGTVYLDYVRWTGTPSMDLGRTPDGGTMWKRAWVNGADRHESYSEAFRVIQNEGRGLVMQGTRDWKDYRVSAELTICLARSAGIAARVQGMRRFYALILDRGGTARLIRSLDGDTVLSEIPFPWEQGSTHRFELEVRGAVLQASVDGRSCRR